ncbi:15792_t:CDS:2, partial [Racocetra fulgida]
MTMSSIAVEKASLTNGISTPNKSKRKGNRTPANEDVQENVTIIQLGSRNKTKKGKNKELNNSSGVRVKSPAVSDTENTNSDTTPEEVLKDERIESSSDGSHEFDKNDENKVNFALKLTPEEADTSKTRPDHHDKAMFENAKIKAEE